MNKLEIVKAFFNRKGINVSGICKEGGFNRSFIELILKDEQKLTDAMFERLLPYIKDYWRGMPDVE